MSSGGNDYCEDCNRRSHGGPCMKSSAAPSGLREGLEGKYNQSVTLTITRHQGPPEDGERWSVESGDRGATYKESLGAALWKTLMRVRETDRSLDGFQDVVMAQLDPFSSAEKEDLVRAVLACRDRARAADEDSRWDSLFRRLQYVWPEEFADSFKPRS